MSKFQNNNIFFNFQTGVLLRTNIFLFLSFNKKSHQKFCIFGSFIFLYTKYIPNTLYSKYFRRSLWLLQNRFKIKALNKDIVPKNTFFPRHPKWINIATSICQDNWHCHFTLPMKGLPTDLPAYHIIFRFSSNGSFLTIMPKILKLDFGLSGVRGSNNNPVSRRASPQASALLYY